MKNLIGCLYQANLSSEQINILESAIKEMLVLDTVEITEISDGYFEVSTDDKHIIDFSVSVFGSKLQEIALGKYHTLDDNHKRVDLGGILVFPEVKCKKKL